MKRVALTLCGLVLAVAALATTGAFASNGASTDRRHDHGFARFLERYEAANEAFVNGDPGPWLAMTAETDPASIFGGFGGTGEAGVATVHQRYLLAATAFAPSGADVDFQYLVKDVRGRLAYTVALERSQVQYTGRTERSDQFLRVTMIFRLHRDGWKIVHRHADTMTALELPVPPPGR